ncbi:uncharacterized protein [Chamaea fasciata]|uniref:uncharacterized protein n=1 Tax=Chamaea fasciata TaxID=190680 RepID=UPI003369DABA
MRPAGPLQPFLEIFQRPSEPFVQFVERLTAAIEQQVAKPQVREDMLEQMAYTHANKRCMAAILFIPKKPGELPSLNEMLQAVGVMAARPLQSQKRTHLRVAAATTPEVDCPQTPNPQKKHPQGSTERLIQTEKKLGGEHGATQRADPNRVARAKGYKNVTKTSNGDCDFSSKQTSNPSQDSSPDLILSLPSQDSPPNETKYLVVWEPETALMTTSSSRCQPKPKLRRACSVVSITQAVLLTSLLWSSLAWIVLQPKANVWKTLAKTLGQDHICLSSAAAGDPLSSCLVGIPLKEEEFPPTLLQMRQRFNQKPSHISHFVEVNQIPANSLPVSNPLSLWKEWTLHLPESSLEPQEVDLLASSQAPFCVYFNFAPLKGQENVFVPIIQIKKSYLPKAWWGQTVHWSMPSMGTRKSLSLPKGIFLICGDRAFPGIPSWLIEGPCTIGRLGLFTPNKTQIMD